MNTTATRRIAILGAGVAGLACGRRLADAGREVAVFEKSRGVGGRTSVRRTDAKFTFDHGTPRFGVTAAAFRAVVDRWLADGVVREVKDADGNAWYAGVGGMNAPCKRLAEGLDVRANVRIARLEPRHGRWRLLDDADGDRGEFDHVVVATPAPQAADLLPAGSAIRGAVAEVRFAPRWVTMLGFDRDVDGHAAAATGTPDAFAVRDDATGGTPGGPTTFEAYRSLNDASGGYAIVLHGPVEWSRAMLERTPAEVARAMTAVLHHHLGIGWCEPSFVAAHRWRYAVVEGPLNLPYLLDRDNGLSACGDWCLGWSVESAYLSGDELGRALVG